MQWGAQLRQHEYQAAMLRAQQLHTPSTQRDYELISASRDVFSPRRDRGLRTFSLASLRYERLII